MKNILIVMCILFSGSLLASTPMAKMENLNGAIQITFSDFAEAVGFENYKCEINMGTWVYSIPANKVVFNNQTYYRCVDQGSLQTGVFYKVSFLFEDRPYNYLSYSPNFLLKAN